MTEGGFEPRIVVPDELDAEIVCSALIGYIGSLTARMALSGCVDLHMIDAMKRATELTGILGEEITAAHVRKSVEIPDDLSGLDDEKRD